MSQYQRRRIQEDIDRQMAANAPQRAIPWGSIINFLVILAVIIAVGAMDRLHADEIAALENIISTQAEIISMTECSGDIEMTMPIGKES